MVTRNEIMRMRETALERMDVRELSRISNIARFNSVKIPKRK
jgi:hypothetical protein